MKKHLLQSIFTTLSFLFAITQTAHAQFGSSSQTFDANGTFTVPAGITTITVEMWGGGGHTPNSINGAGGGAYVRSISLSVTPGNQYTVNVSRWLTPQNTVFVNGSFGGLISVNSAVGEVGGAANSISGLTAVSYRGGDGGKGFDFGIFGISYGGGGAAAGRNGNGAFGCDGLGALPSCGVGVNGGGSGGTGSSGIQGSIPGGGCSANTFMSAGGVQGRCIVWWSCPSSAGTIGNAHTVPAPEESTFDLITSLTPANGSGNTITYSWQQSSDNVNWIAAGSTNATQYNIPNISSNTYYRRTLNSCGSGNSNSVLIKVFSQGNGLKNGTISGRVTSLNGTGVAGITVSAQKTIALQGSPQSYIYSTTTDINGFYTLENIFYGDLNNGDPSSVSFTITPSKANHVFSPVLTASLSNTNPTRANQNFTDSTVYAITGKTYQECTTCVDVNGVSQASVIAPLDSVLMYKNGSFFAKSGYVTPPGDYGRWATTVQDPGNYTINPSFNSHTFLPASTTLNVTNNVSNVDFKDTTTHVISGYLRAGCSDYIGTTVLEFADVLPNDANGQLRPSVFRKRVTTNNLTGFYSIRLPARKYKVKVISFSPSITNTTDPDYIYEADLLAFFNTNYGGSTNITALPYSALERDVTTHDTTLHLTYQRPPTIALFGLVDSCINLSDPSLTYSVWKQAETKALGFKIYQGSVAKGCPLTADTLRLSTNVHVDDVNEEFLIPVVNDSAKKNLKGGVPNIIAPYYKVFNAQYHDQYGRYANRDINNNTGIAKNIVVTGVKSDAGFYTTVSPELPMMILHDPPGDLSSSTWSSSQTNESALRWNVAAGTGIETFLKVKLGTKLITGLGVAIESEVWGSVQGGISVSSRFNGGEESILTTTATQTISTSSDEDVTGAGGDLFMGAAVNLLYSIAHEIKYTGCNITNTKRLMIAQDGFATTYYYTDDAIRNSVIPTLIQFKNNPGNTAAQTANYANQISVWQQVLGNNEMNKARAAFDRNVSFFGSAGPVSFSTTTSSSKTSSFDFNLEIENSVATELGLEIGGSGITGGATVKFKMETGVSTNNTSTQSTTVGYTLDDNEANDNFTVNIKKDPVYNTPVFETVAGQSSCPPESGTYLRDAMQLIIPVPSVSGVAPNGDAIFTMLLGNLSADASPRTYNLTFDQSSNPFGATILIGGSPVVGGVPTPYTIASGGQVTVTVVVRKNVSSNIYSYEGLTFTLSDACDGSISKSGTISAYFNSPCSNITLVAPEDNWINRITDNNIIDVAFNGYTVANLQSVTLEYSSDGTSNWNTGFTKQQNQINNSVNGTTVNWDVSNIPDGKYNLRLKLNCATGIIYSYRVTGIIDRKAPGLFGKPEPTDNNYLAGDPVSFSYDENIDNTNLNSGKVSMTLLSNNSNIPVSVSGFGNKIAISPSVNLLSYAGDSVRVVVHDIADIYGNVKTTADTIYFTIGTFIPSTGPNAANVTVNYSPMFENASSMIDVVFTLASPAPNNVRINYTLGGTAIYNNDYLIDSLAATRISGVQGYVIIPQNGTQAIVKIDPVGDNAAEQDETVIVSIAEGGDYTLGSNYSATAVILSDEIPSEISA
ncbi:MAG: carboxypeptidase-like regulatory domain-containing protein, partial [Bacteroidota bacterium]